MIADLSAAYGGYSTDAVGCEEYDTNQADWFSQEMVSSASEGQRFDRGRLDAVVYVDRTWRGSLSRVERQVRSTYTTASRRPRSKRWPSLAELTIS